MPNVFQKIKSHYIELFVLVLGAGITTIMLVVENYVITQWMPQIESKTIVRVIAGLLFVLFLSWSYVLYLRPCLKFDEKTSTWINLKNNVRYCHSCKAKKKLSPLRSQQNGWQCCVKGCSMFYPNPDVPQPSKRLKVISKGFS